MVGYQRSSCPWCNENKIHPQTPSLFSFVSLSLCFSLIKSCLLINRGVRVSPLSGREQQQQLPWGMVLVVVVVGLGSVCVRRRCWSVVNANEALPSLIYSQYIHPGTNSISYYHTLSLTVSRPIYLKVLRVHTPSSTFV